MATRDELLNVLERLVLAYPDRELSPETASVYLTELGDVPIRWLGRAARHWINTQSWFPRISDLRQTALKLAGVCDFYEPESYQDLLMDRYHHLCQCFWKELQVDEQAWLELAADFEAANRPHMAERTLQRVEAFQKELEKQGEGEEGEGGEGTGVLR